MKNTNTLTLKTIGRSRKFKINCADANLKPAYKHAYIGTTTDYTTAKFDRLANKLAPQIDKMVRQLDVALGIQITITLDVARSIVLHNHSKNKPTKPFTKQTAINATVAFIRHVHSNYHNLLLDGYDGRDYEIDTIGLVGRQQLESIAGSLHVKR